MGRPPTLWETQRCAAIPEYRSSFLKWDQRASVRVKPQRRTERPAPDQIYFPPELVPVASHPLVQMRGPDAVRRLLVARLHMYLSFTVELETSAVIPVTTEISLNRCGLDLPGQMRRDAFKITTDEAWHAQFSDELRAEITDLTSVPALLPERPGFLDRLAKVREEIGPGLRGCTPLAFAIVSETLVSGILSDLPKDRRLPTSVRGLVSDHAEDEGKHHAYFRSVLRYFWPALSDAERRRLGIWLPELITIFLEPDYSALAFALFDLGLSDDEVGQVLVESHPPDDVREQVADSSRATVRYLQEMGVLDDPATREAFLTAGMLLS